MLYAIAFVYFTYSTIFAIYYEIPTYAGLWQVLGRTYTLSGGFMVAGGLMFATASVRRKAFGRTATGLFALGLFINLALSLLPTPEILQIGGSLLRNLGLIGMGLEGILRISEPSYN